MLIFLLQNYLLSVYIMCTKSLNNEGGVRFWSSCRFIDNIGQNPRKNPRWKTLPQYLTFFAFNYDCTALHLTSFQ